MTLNYHIGDRLLVNYLGWGWSLAPIEVTVTARFQDRGTEPYWRGTDTLGRMLFGPDREIVQITHTNSCATA